MAAPRKVWFVVTGDWPEQVTRSGMALRFDAEINCWVIHDGREIWDVEASRVFEEDQAPLAEVFRAMVEIQARAIYDEEPEHKPLEFPVPSPPEPMRYRTWHRPESPVDPEGYITVTMREWL